MRPPHRRTSRARHAVTLVEMLVVSGALVVVLGLALGLATQSARATRRIARRQAALEYVQRVMDEVSRLVHASAAPGNIGMAEAFDDAAERFERDRLTLLTCNAGERTELRQITVGMAREGNGRLTKIVRSVKYVNGEQGLTYGAGSESDWLGSSPEGCRIDLRFGYAAEVRPAQTLRWADEWTSTGRPALIRAVVRAEVQEDDSTREITLKTAWAPPAAPPETRTETTP